MSRCIFRIISALLLIMLSAFPVSAQTRSATVIYVSSSSGSDSNDGLTDRAPMKSIRQALKSKPSKILLRRGDVFYESVSLNGTDIDAYGEGKIPMLCGYKYVPKGRKLWKEGLIKDGKWIAKSGTHLWRIDLEGNGFTGRNDYAEKALLNNIGFIRDLTHDTIYGRKCEFVYQADCNDPYEGERRNSWLEADGEFWQSSAYNRKDMKPEEVRYLYLRFSSNPNKIEWALSTYGDGVTLRNGSARNIRVEGFGSHGFACKSNSRVEYCEIDYIGGSNLFGFSKWVRYGNGIEYYGGQQHGYVAHNYIAHTFDTATTIQSSAKDGVPIDDIVFEYNYITNCRQDFEIFLSNVDTEGRTNDCTRCYFRNNLCIGAGDTGYGCNGVSDCHIISYMAYYKTSGIKIEDNVFIGGYGFFGEPRPYNMPIGKGNVFYFNGTTVLWSGRWKDKCITSDQGGSLDAAIHAYREKTGDMNTKFVKLY